MIVLFKFHPKPVPIQANNLTEDSNSKIRQISPQVDPWHLLVRVKCIKFQNNQKRTETLHAGCI